jgi:hypothetical protein
MWRLTPRDYKGDQSFSLCLQDQPYSLGRFIESSIVIRPPFAAVSKKQGFFKVKKVEEGFGIGPKGLEVSDDVNEVDIKPQNRLSADAQAVISLMSKQLE